MYDVGDDDDSLPFDESELIQPVSEVSVVIVASRDRFASFFSYSVPVEDENGERLDAPAVVDPNSVVTSSWLRMVNGAVCVSPH